MSDRKFTDDEVIKALECCVSGYCIDGKCPLFDWDDEDDISKCTETLATIALALINRQKAELEDLREIVFTDRTEAIRQLKAEAIKEFAERLKAEKFKHANFGELVYVEDIDNLVKEMTEGGGADA